MRAAEPVCRAAFAVASVLYALALPWTTPVSGGCERPAEHSVHGEHTSAVRCAGPAALSPLRGPARRLFGLALDPNRADAYTLETLPGVGPARAAAIVRAREERPFESVEDLMRAPGVGPVTLSRVAPLLSVVSGAERDSRSSDGLPRSGLRSWEDRW